MSSSSPSLLSSRLPSPATLFTKKPASLRSVSSATARHGVRVVVVAASAAAAAPVSAARVRPSAAEVARTVVELAASGTLSVVGPDGWPLGVGARFVTDAAGAPALCLAAAGVAAPDAPSSFHVEFRQSGARTPQCTMLGALIKPSDESVLKKLSIRWQKKFGEEIDQDLLYLISVDRILHMEDFNEDGMWVVPSEYTSAEPDPLRNFAENIVEEFNSKNAEDVHRIYSIYVESDLKVADVKMIWVDRLGFDFHVHSGEGVFAVRIPFSREVSDEKGVKSSFNMMSHHAWEVEKSYASPAFEKIQWSVESHSFLLRAIAGSGTSRQAYSQRVRSRGREERIKGFSYLLCGNCTSCPMLFECWLSSADFSSYTICIEMDDFAVYSFQYSEIPVYKML